MNTSMVHVRRMQNWSNRFIKHKIYVDGVCVASVKCGETKSFNVESEKKHNIHIEEQIWVSEGLSIYFESGKEYYFESGRFLGGDGLGFDYHGHQFDESGAAPIVKGFRAVKSLFSND